MSSRFARGVVAGVLLVGASPAPGQTPSGPPAQPTAPVVTVDWKRAGTTDPVAPIAPLAPPTVVVTTAPTPVTPAPQSDQLPGVAAPTALPTVRPRGAAPDEFPGPIPSGFVVPAQIPGSWPPFAPGAIVQPANTAPAAPGTVPPKTGDAPAAPAANTSGGGGADGKAEGAGAKPAGGDKPPPKFHGHKYAVQPFPRPGANPIQPTGEGYYTLLQLIQGAPGEKAPRWPYPRSSQIGSPFNEFDFSYLDPVPFEDRDWAEKLHRIPLGDHWLFSTGGEIRYRYNSESNTRLSGVNDTYDLIRIRDYVDLWYEDVFRLFGEFYFGDTANQDFTPYARDVNRGDFQQLFFDLKVWETGDGNPVYVRGGRQELLYGSQRLISPGDWGNNRQKFDGVKGFYRSAKWDVDVFAVRPTLVGPGTLDTWDVHQTFSGVWFAYKPKAATNIDLYYLDLDNVNRNVAKGRGRSGGFNVSTFGARYYDRFDNGLLVDLEGMLQVGHWADQSILAQAFHTYAGWYFKDVWATPTVWFGLDYASGDPDPNNTGQHRTFNQLFQFGHYYYGWVDITGGQNIHDFNVQAYAYPAKWVTTGTQYHVFRLSSDKDALYNSSGSVLRQDKTGKAGDDVGSELDLMANFHLTNRQDILLTYSHFFPGTFIQLTGPANKNVPLDYVYAQYTVRW